MSVTFSLVIMASAFVLSAAMTPLSLGIWILLFAFIVAMMASSTISSWWGLVIFLIYIGGLLVMFAYFSAVTPNQQWDLAPLFLFASSFSLILWLNNEAFLSPDILTSFEYYPISTNPATALLYYQNIFIYLGLALILFLALVMVVKISSLTSGPLRPFF